jgi:hypothetical protein
MPGDDFWRKAYACLTCGKPHEHLVVKRRANGDPFQYSWADPEDGHYYRTIIGLDDLAKLRHYMEEKETEN